MLLPYYPIHSQQQLENYLKVYIPLVFNQLNIYGVDIKAFGITGDHFGLQVLSAEEFDKSDTLLQTYATLVNAGEMHNRRNNIYKLTSFPKINDIEIQSIEMFEPKPDADINKLKPGIEHIALVAQKYDELHKFFIEKQLPIDKSADFNGSKFFKTKFVNLVEVEFRNDYLWQAIQL